MRQFLLLVSILICASHLSAQNEKQKFKARLTETSVVKDTAGNEIPYVLWKPLMMSADISFKAVNPADENSAFLIFRLTPEEKKKMLEAMPRPTESKSFITGANFSHFNETDIYGNKFKTKDLKGKILVLNFWFINCPPCKMEIPELNELVESYKENKDVLFIAIALDEKYDLKDFLKRNPFNYSIVERGTSLAASYKVQAFPTHVVVDKEGKVKFHTMGLARNTVHWLKKSIEEILTTPSADGLAAGK